MSRLFNGSTDLITTASTTFSSATSHSFSLWVYAVSLPNGYNGLITQVSNNGPILYIRSSNAFAFYGQTWANRTADPVPNSTVTLGTWNHFCCRASSAAVDFFFNGVKCDSAGGGWTIASVSSQQVFGEDINNAGRFFNGRLAHVAFWDGITLTDAEALALSNGALPNMIRPAALINWWPLSGLSSPEPDLGGTAKNGTLTGTTVAGGPPVMAMTPRWPQTPIIAAGGFKPAWAINKNQIFDGVAT